MRNEIYDLMMAAYDLSTTQHQHNAVFEVNQQIILAGLYHGGFFDTALFMAARASAYFMGFNVSLRTWISPSSYHLPISILPNIFNPSLMSLQWWAEMWK